VKHFWIVSYRIVSYRDILCDIVSYRIVSLMAVSCHHYSGLLLLQLGLLFNILRLRTCKL